MGWMSCLISFRTRLRRLEMFPLPRGPSAAKSLEDQQTAADQAEAEVKREASTGAGGGGF